MNTPEPCNKCIHLYVNALNKDDPFYMTECKLDLEMGVEACEKFSYWKSTTTKTPEMKDLLERIAINSFDRPYRGSVCVVCGSNRVEPEDFADDLSYVEFHISRMCQVCQDRVFGY